MSLAACGSEDVGPVRPFSLNKATPVPQTGIAGEAPAEAPVIEVKGAEGMVVQGVVVELDVELGGGSVASAQVVTDGDGMATIQWTLGLPPVMNRLRAVIEAGTPDESSVTFDVQAEAGDPLIPEPFGDVNGFLESNDIQGTTEDLVFDNQGRVLMGVPGGILAIDPGGAAEMLELTGDDLATPFGIAVDEDGNIWVADGQARALKKVSPEGDVETVFEDDGIRDLEGPNYIAIGPEGDVYLSDPCLGEIIRYDPVAQEIVAILSFAVSKDGGPNGFAFNAEGDRMFVVTENTGILCQHSDIDVKAPVASLFTVGITEDGFGQREPVALGIGLFGDGMAFDAEGNLYVIVDRLLEGTLTLDDSAIWVLPKGGSDLVKFASIEDPLTQGILANVAFGQGEFGETTLYIALLTMPPFSPEEKRGLMRVDVGIVGQSLFR